MRRMLWMVLDFILAASVAILGNIVASYLQERFNLTDRVRFVSVAVLFVVCLGLLLLATLKRSRTGTDHQADGMDERGIQVRQRIKRVERKGKVVGVEAKKLPSSLSTSVEQDANEVAGEMTGVRIGRSNETCSENHGG